jgi:hypothetical protein
VIVSDASARTDTPQWQPLSALAQITLDIDEQFANTREQYATLLEARDRPHVLDDGIVARFVRLITDELEFLPIYREQLLRWYQAAPNSLQILELDRLTHQINRWDELLSKQLALAQEMSAGTIEKVLAKSNLELGIEALLRMTSPPKGK